MARKPRDPQVMITLLEKHGPDFIKNGSLVYRHQKGRKPCWCLRFRTKEPGSTKFRQRGISLGTNPAIADNVGQFLAVQRQKRVAARQQAQQAREARRVKREETKAYLKVLFQASSYSRREKNRIRALVSGKNRDAGTLIRLSFGGRLRTRPRGRPVKNRLW